MAVVLTPEWSRALLCRITYGPKGRRVAYSTVDVAWDDSSHRLAVPRYGHFCQVLLNG